ncbi:MAG: hypothetical protein CVT61_07660, partial [Actinobacteria bacterium HGW-Actinobacteria-11]
MLRGGVGAVTVTICMFMASALCLCSQFRAVWTIALPYWPRRFRSGISLRILQGYCGQKMEDRADRPDMMRPNPWRLAALLILIVAVFGGAGLVKGAFYIGKHEGDTLHLAEIVLRMAAGQWPHLDFMTPIGALAMAPLALLVRLGAGLGHAIFLSQILVALILMPAVIRVARSRFGSPWGWAYGGFVMILCVALVHGEAQRAVSISMHYNRWSWAIAYVVLPLVMIAPEGRARPWLDGVILGLGMAALVLIKATYFAALMPAVVV